MVRHVFGRIGPPQRRVDQAGLGQLPAAEELGDLLSGPGLPVGCAAVVDAFGGGGQCLAALAGDVGDDKKAARSRSGPQTANDPLRVVSVHHEVQDCHQHDRGRLAEIDEAADHRVGQDRGVITHISLDDGGLVAGGEQLAALGNGDRVPVDICHPGIGCGRCGYLVHAARNGDA